MEIRTPTASVDLFTGRLKGRQVLKTIRKLKHMEGYYVDQKAYQEADLETPTYEVEIHEEAGTAGNAGALAFGTTFLFPGRVGNEYFMTKGHLHNKRDRAEYYWGIQGEGVLVLMDEAGEAIAEKVEPGSLHYIGANIAHRLVNTGASTLAVGACWNSDAGHDYDVILEKGFSIRVIEEKGKPVLVKSGSFSGEGL